MLPKSLGSVRHGEGEQASDLTDDRMMYPKNILKMVQQNMIYIYIYGEVWVLPWKSPKKALGALEIDSLLNIEALLCAEGLA